MIEVDESIARSSHGLASGATAFHRLRGGLGWLLVLLLPPVMVLAGYHRPMFQGAKEWPISGDAAFYAYQFVRIGELRGQWWKLGQDDLVGAPYQPIFGKHPGVFEGVDLLLVSTFSSRWLDPVTNYHVMMMLVLLVSGWIAGVIVRRFTGSSFWAAVCDCPLELELLDGLPIARPCPPLQVWVDHTGRHRLFALSRPTDSPSRTLAGAGDGACASGLVLPGCFSGPELRSLVAGHAGCGAAEPPACAVSGAGARRLLRGSRRAHFSRLDHLVVPAPG